MFPPKVRIRGEVALSSLACVLGLVTIVRQDWIEVVFGVDPDGGSGATEWVVVALCFALSVVLLSLALRDVHTRQAESEASRRVG